MIWFFKKKKVTVPIPENHEDLLQFPRSSSKRTIPEEIKKSVGLEEPPQMPDMALPEEPTLGIGAAPAKTVTPAPNYQTAYPFFLRVQSYQELIKDTSDIKTHVLELDLTTEKLENSEFNENKNYEKLKRELRKVHERLLFMDDLIFKK